MQDRELAQRQIRMLRVIGGAMSLGILVFAGITIFFIAGDGFDFTFRGESSEIVPMVFFPLGLLLIVLGPALARRLGEAPPSADRGQVANRYSNAAIIGFAMIEGGGFLGILGALFTSQMNWALVFALGAVAMMVVSRPREEELVERLRRADRG